jgi:hypothetical protein
MHAFNRRTLCLILAASSLSAAVAQDTRPAALQSAAPAMPAAASHGSSEEGLARLARSSAKVDFPALANQFEPQSNSAFCGPTSVAIVLNTVRARAGDLPRDKSRLRPEDGQYLPPGADLSVPRYTQENIFGKSQKTRAQVLGETVTINGKPMRDFGFQLRQLDDLLRAHGMSTRMVVVDDAKSESAIRTDLIGNLSQGGDYAIVNYRREAVGQKGGGHISPLGAYDAVSDSFLVMDVNPTAAGWVWMPTATLVRGMHSFDTVENRGYILVQPL